MGKSKGNKRQQANRHRQGKKNKTVEKSGESPTPPEMVNETVHGSPSSESTHCLVNKDMALESTTSFQTNGQPISNRMGDGIATGMLSPTERGIPIPVEPSGIIPSHTLPCQGGSAEEVQIPALSLSSLCRDHLALQVDGTKRISPIVEQNVLAVGVLEKELCRYLAKDLLHVGQKDLDQCRLNLRLHHENIILEDPEYCIEMNVEESLWNLVYFHVIESLRKCIEDHPVEKAKLTQTLLNIVHEGTVFYENLLKKQQETYKFNLTHLLSDEVFGSSVPESIRVVLVSCQKIFICLGDLAFYKEEVSGTSRYNKARSCYWKAQQISPKHEKPHYKLATVSRHMRKKMDAVYYYMRSLATSNPFLSSKESLLSLFDGVRKKVRQSTEAVIDDELESLSSDELNKRFIDSFLNVHGKLFSANGMETFVDSMKKMLKEFHFLLKHTPLPIRSSRLLQIMAVNMFSVENASVTEMSQNSSLKEHALQVILSMVSIIMEHCCTMCKEHLESPEYTSRLLSHELTQLLPAVKVWADWMLCHKNLWEPPFVQNKEFQTGYEKDVWFSFANLLTTLRKIDRTSYETSVDNLEGYDPMMLEEDADLAGFYPLLGTSVETFYVKTTSGKSNAKNFLRLLRIQSFGDYLRRMSTPYLKFNGKRKKFISLVDQLL